MKKTISLILIFLFIFPTLLTPVIAESQEEFTAEEAYALLNEAFVRYEMFRHDGFYSYLDVSQFQFVHRLRRVGDPIKYHTSADGEPYKNLNGYYFTKFISVPEFPADFVPDDYNHSASRIKIDETFNRTFKTKEDVMVYYREVFTEEMAKESMYIGSYYSEKADLFRYSEDGELMMCCWVETRAADCTIEDMISFKVNNNKATMVIEILEHAVWADAFNETVQFTKENDGWKISGGSFFGFLHGNIGIDDLTPNTGDPSAIAIPALAVSALVSLAVPVGIMRRRRRYA